MLSNVRRFIHRCNILNLQVCVPFRQSCTDLLDSLKRRGLIKEIFPKDHPVNTPKVPCAYAGFDATADSLHIGNLLVLIALLHWQRAGYKTLIVLGDATAEIGDPSGHSSDRKILSHDDIQHNANSIEKNLQEVFENYEKYVLSKFKATKRPLGQLCIMRNSNWYHNTSIVDFISEAGREIRVADMLSRTSVKSRMDSGAGINFSEFSYQVFQSYDWLHLFKVHDCRFQFGGSDQLGNITSGYALISGSQYQHVYGCLLPLIQSESGDKFGKTAGNAVYLAPHRTSPYDFYQFFMRLPDADVLKCLKLFTFLTLEEVEGIFKHHLKNPDLRRGQRKIAEEITLLVHGEKGLNIAQTVTNVLFHSDLSSLAKLDASVIKNNFPNTAISEIMYEPGMSVLDLAMKAGCFLNTNDANRIISAGGLHLNFEKISSTRTMIIPNHHILENGITLIRIGKKNYYLVTWK